MKALLFTCLLLFSIPCFSQYNVVADTTNCLLEIQRQQGQIRYSFELSQLRYADRSGGYILIFDNAMSVTLNNTQIWNYATLAGLKARLDTWAIQCEE